MLDDDLEKRFDEYREKHYPRLNRSAAVGMLVETELQPKGEVNG